MSPKEYAISLLAQGISTSQVAAAVGVDDSYISQLRADPEVQQSIAVARSEHAVADTQFDNTLERAESLALEKIEKNLPFANMGQALAAFRILNGARRRKDQFAQTEQHVSVTVSLTLPQATIPRYVTNSQNEIIEVEGQTMISATPKTLDQILAARADGALLPKVTEVEKAANMLDMLKSTPRQAPRKLPPQLSADML